MIIQGFKHFQGQHCETTATGCLLNQIGIELSEPMLFGLGEGLGFIFWRMKSMNFPFIGGRVKTDELTENVCRNLNLNLQVTETASKKKAWQNAHQHIDKGKIVGLKLDCYHLDYFSTKFHFAGHYVAMYGYDDLHAYLVDTDQQGGKVKTTLESLALARSEKGPMSSKNRTYTIHKNNTLPSLEIAIKKAIYNNATAYLNPPIKNFNYKGILKTSSEIKNWFNQSKDIKGDFQTTAMLMERAGTGGSLFRNLYRDFLKESYEYLKMESINEAHLELKKIAELWKNVAELFFQVGETSDVIFIDQASEVLIEISKREKLVLEKLQATCK